MPYKISKPVGDARVTNTGFIIPDGCYIVLEMTEENMKQILNVRDKGGYLVEKTDLPEGHYFSDGRRVEKRSLQRWGYARREGRAELPRLEYIDDEPITERTPDQAPVEVPRDEVAGDVALLRAKLDAKGIEYSKHMNARTLEAKLRQGA